MLLHVSPRRAAQLRPDAQAISMGDDIRSWSTFAADIARLGASLSARGVEPGARVVVIATNGPDTLALMYAVWWVGAVWVPLNTRLPAAALAHQIADADAKLVVVDERFVTLELGRSALVLEALCDDSNHREASEPFVLAPDALAALLYTGGTTGAPKGVMLSHAALAYNALNCAREMGFEGDSRLLHAPPLYHIGAVSAATALTLVAGAHVFTSGPGFDIPTYLDAVAREAITDLFLVPTMIAMVLADPTLARLDAAARARVRALHYGGSPIDAELLTQIREVLPNVGLRQFYGMTELCGSGTVLRPRDHVPEHLTSAGQAMAGVELRILDPHTREPVECGALGEVVVRSPGQMLGYWRQPERSAAAVRQGWLHTGDLGVLDEHGFLTLVDRVKDMIISGGENVYSIEVERVLASCPGVEACAVIGLPDPTWGERVVAILVPTPTSSRDEEAILAHCRAELGGHQVPRTIIWRDVPLPQNPAGKVLKRELRSSYGEPSGDRSSG